MRRLRDESGSILVLTVLGMTVLVGIAAIAIDAGNWYYTQRQLQSLADAAAMAGALELNCGSSSCTTAVDTAAKKALAENGNTLPTANFSAQCTAPSSNATGILLTVNNAPCALLSKSADPNFGNAHYVEAVVTKQVPTYFAGFFGMHNVTISARAEAGFTAPPGGPCMEALQTSGQSVTLNSGAKITDAPTSNCGLQVNSNANSGTSANGCSGTEAVMEDGGATVDVASYNVVGGVCDNGGTYTPAPTTGAQSVNDPFNDEITNGTLKVPSQGANQGISLVSGGPPSSPSSLSPGYYPSGLTFQGQGNVTLSAGTYYFDGTVMINSGITVTGSNVTIYMNNGQFIANSGSTVNISAPTTGDQAGMLIWQNPKDTSELILDSDNNSTWKGGVYSPGGQVTLNGGSKATLDGMLIANTFMINANVILEGKSSGGGTGTIALSE